MKRLKELKDLLTLLENNDSIDLLSQSDSGRSSEMRCRCMVRISVRAKGQKVIDF
jgi:hypothetical protein